MSKKKYFCSSEIFDPLLRRLYKSGQDNYAKELLDEILDFHLGLDYSTKELVCNEWMKRVQPGESVDGKYMVDAVSKMCYGCAPGQVLTQLVVKLCRCGHVDTAFDIVYLSQRSGGCPDNDARNALLNGLGREKNVDKMKMLFNDMLFEEMVSCNFRYVSNVATFRIVVYHLCRLQRVDEALQVLHSSEPSDIIINNMIIKGLCNVGRQEEGLAFADRMRSHIAPNIVTYNVLIGGFCKAGEIKRSRKLFDKMNEERIPANVTTLNTLVDGMCKHGGVSSAFDFFTEMRMKGLEGNASTYTILLASATQETLIRRWIFLTRWILLQKFHLIDLLCKEKRTEDALSLMDEMNVKGLHPNAATYNAIFRGLRDMNSLDKAFKLMDNMKGQACHPNEKTMEILSEWLSAEGEATRLKSFFLSV